MSSSLVLCPHGQRVVIGVVIVAVIRVDIVLGILVVAATYYATALIILFIHSSTSKSILVESFCSKSFLSKSILSKAENTRKRFWEQLSLRVWERLQFSWDGHGQGWKPISALGEGWNPICVKLESLL